MRVLDWFRDRAIRKVIRYGLPVTIGKFVTSIASLVTVALLAHYLGPGPFGVIALIRTVVAVVDQYANFNTLQVIVKYGTEAMAQRRTDDVKRAIKLAVIVDVVSALLAAVVIASIAFLGSSAFDWNMRESILCAVYAITIVTRVSGATDGIFRICDAYRSQAIVASVGAFTMTGAVAIAIAIDGSFTTCVVALIAGEVIGNLINTIASFWVAGQAGYAAWWRTPLDQVRTTFPGIIRFMLATNGQLTVKKTQGELDMFVVGGMLGNVAAGLFRLVKQLGTIPARVFMPFEQVIFTELAKYAAADDLASFSRLLRRSVALVMLGSLAMWFGVAIAGELIIRLVGGPEFVDATPAFRWYMLAMALNVANTPIQRAMVALGKPGILFFSELALLAVLAAMTVAAAHSWALTGVAAAVAVHKVIQLAWSTWLVVRVLRQRRTRA